MKDNSNDEYDNNAFQEGDRVWSRAYGWGTVTEIGRPTDTYPIRVRFDQCHVEDSWMWYTMDGCFEKHQARTLKHQARTLFFAEIPIPPEALVRPVKFERGEVVQWRENGGFQCFGFYIRPDGNRHRIVDAFGQVVSVAEVRKPVMPEIDEVAQEASDEQN